MTVSRYLVPAGPLMTMRSLLGSTEDDEVMASDAGAATSEPGSASLEYTREGES